MGGHQSISTGLNRFYIGVMKKSTSMDDGWINTTITVKWISLSLSGENRFSSILIKKPLI